MVDFLFLNFSNEASTINEHPETEPAPAAPEPEPIVTVRRLKKQNRERAEKRAEKRNARPKYINWKPLS